MSTAAAVRTELEAILRTRHLDRTLTTGQPWGQADACQLAATGIAALDERLGGGWPRGELSDIVGPRSSGRTSVLTASMAAATSRGEAVAFIDTGDTLDIASAAAAGVDLDLMLWARVPCPVSRVPDLDRAIKAFNIVLQAGGFGLVALDLCDVPAAALRALPYTTWMRLQRVLLGASTVALVVGAEPVARSARGVTVELGSAGRWQRGLFGGLDVTARVKHGRHVRWGSDENVRLSVSSTAS